MLHVSVFCKLQDFIKQLGCCVTCFQPGDADGEQSTERRVRPSRELRRCGRGRSMLALVSRYEERLQGTRARARRSRQWPGEIFSRGKYDGARRREGRARPGENGQVMMADVCGLAGPRAQSSRMWSAGLRAVTWHQQQCLVAGSARAAAVDSKCISGGCMQPSLPVPAVSAPAAGHHGAGLGCWPPPAAKPLTSILFELGRARACTPLLGCGGQTAASPDKIVEP